MQTVTIVLSAFLAGLAPSMIDSAMDHVQAGLLFSNGQRLAMQSIGIVVFLAALLIATDLHARLGGRRFAILAAAALTLSSLSAAFAPSYSFLVASYAALRFGCAGVISCAFIRSASDPERRRRGRTLCILLCAFLIGSGLGPALAQSTIDAADWRWVCLSMATAGTVLVTLQTAFIARVE